VQGAHGYPGSLNAPGDVRESGQLHRVELVFLGKPHERPLDRRRTTGTERHEKLRRATERNAEPAHPGVEVCMHGDRFAHPACDTLDLSRRRLIYRRETNAAANEHLGIIIVDPGHEEDRLVQADVRQFVRRPGGHDRARRNVVNVAENLTHEPDPEPVGVVLHDGDDRASTGEPRNLTRVRHDRRRVDLEPGLERVG